MRRKMAIAAGIAAALALAGCDSTPIPVDSPAPSAVIAPSPAASKLPVT